MTRCADEAADTGLEDTLDAWAAHFMREEARRRRQPRRAEQRQQKRFNTLTHDADVASAAALEEMHCARDAQDATYGVHAAELRALEAQLNRRFDAILHAKQPLVGPAVALRSTN